MWLLTRGWLALGLAACASPPVPVALDRCGEGALPPHEDVVAGRDGFTRWAPPGPSVLHLTQISGEVSGPTPTDASALSAWTDFSGWSRSQPGHAVRLRSPVVPALAGSAAWMSITLRPAGATSVEVVLFSSSGTEVTDRVSRSTRVLLPADADPKVPVTLRVDIQDLVGGNWADAWKRARLTGVELTLEGPDPTRAELLELRLQNNTARYSAAPAGTATLELMGALRPGWYVHGGAGVKFHLHVPEQAPELRWAAGALDAAGRVQVIDGASATELPVQSTDSVWTPQAVSLAPWAGRDVTLSLSATGNGLAFFGDPRLISGPEQVAIPDVLVYLIDALRADALHGWGSPVADVSPTLDRLAAEGVQFTEAMSTSNWTKPAIPTLMSGVGVMRHRVGSQRFTDRLPEGVPVIQERLRDAGWRTGSFSANPLGSTLTGLDRGFDLALPPRRWRGQISAMGAPTAEQLHAGLLDWLAEEPDLPFFAYVHTLEVHQSYRPPFVQADPRAAYEASIRAADAGLATLLERLSARHRPLLVVVTSDHGESFGDHGLQTHGTGLYGSQVHIPLIFWANQDLPSLRVDAPVGLADVAPTLLSLLGLDPLEAADGLSLRPLIDGKGSLNRLFVASTLLRFSWAPDAPRQYALTSAKLGKIIQREDGHEEIYDLRADPCELHPVEDTEGLAPALQGWRAQEEAAAAAFAAQYGAPLPAAVDDETVRQLRRLGYLK